MAGLSSPTAGCVDTTEWPLERELGQCVERERLGSLPATGLWATLKATTDCGCRLLLLPLLLLGTPCCRNWAVGLHPNQLQGNSGEKGLGVVLFGLQETNVL